MSQVLEAYNKAPWYKLTPVLRSQQGSRVPAIVQHVYDQFDVDVNPRYKPSNGNTYCNIFVWDCTKAMGCEIPHWYFPRTGAPAEGKVEDAMEMTANGMCEWLHTVGSMYGWARVDEVMARKSAGEGHCVVGTWLNLHGHGHVAMMNPDGTVSMAGAICAKAMTVERAFPPVLCKNVQWYAHE